jgi:hypothetical protein
VEAHGRGNDDRINVRIREDILDVGADLPNTQGGSEFLDCGKNGIGNCFKVCCWNALGNGLGVEFADPTSADQGNAYGLVCGDGVVAVAQRDSCGMASRSF